MRSIFRFDHAVRWLCLLALAAYAQTSSAQLITNLAVNNSTAVGGTGVAYQTCPGGSACGTTTGFVNGALQFLDRTYHINTSVPTGLSGQAFVMTANSDKAANPGATNFVSFTLGQAATVYVAYCTAITTKPSWLTSNFTSTGQTVSNDNGYSFALYSRGYASGSTVTLGSNVPAGGTTTAAMYTVIVAPSTGGPIAYVQSKNNSPNNSALGTLSATFTGAQTAGNFNVVAVGWGTGSTGVSSVTDSKGNVYTLAVGPTVTSFGNASIYYAKNIAAAAAGTNAVTVTFSAAVPWPDVRIAEYSGISTTSPLDVTAVSTGTGTTSDSGFATTTYANDLLIGSNWVSTGTSGAGTGYTQRQISGWDGDILEDRIVAATGAYNATAAVSPSGSWIMQMVAFKGTGAAADTTPPTAPSGLSATAISSTQVNLTWTASTDDVGVTGYFLERCQGNGCSNFAQVATPSSSPYNDTGLTANTTYSYRVRAHDAANNLSSYSSVLAVVTSTASLTISGISGTVAAGQAVTISGSGFGSHPSYNNVADTWSGGQYVNFRFKDFEDAALNSHGFYAQSGGAPWTPTATDLSIQSGGPANSTKFMRRMYDQENGGLSADVVGAGNQLYTTFKFMIAPGTQSGKVFRFYADSPQNNMYISTGCTDVLVRGFSECTAASCTNAATQWGQGPELTPSLWHRLEFWINADNNTVTASVDGTVAWTMPNWLNTTLALNGHTVDYPNMIDGARDPSCPPVGAYNYDDIYVDFTQARVEIGNASTWSAVTHKEIQIPTTWSNSSIQIRINKGEFASGTQAYLYVVDANGAVNPNGTPLTIQ